MENYTNFNEYLETEYEPRYFEYEKDEFYTCNGGHLWHISEIKKEYYNNKPNKTFNYSEILNKCGIETY